MARILIATTPAAGHVNPMVPFARELVNRGHTVWWYTGKVFQHQIKLLGATYKPMHAAYDFGGMSREQAFPQTQGLQGVSAFIKTCKHIFIEQAPKQMEDIFRLLEKFPADLLIGDDMCYGLGFVYEKTGIPLINISNSIYTYSSIDTAPIGLALPPDNSLLGRIRNIILHFLNDHLVLRELKTYIDRTRTSVGLPKLNKRILENMSQPPNLYLLGTVPEFEYPRSDLYENTHFVGAFISPPLEQFNPPAWWNDLDSNRPVVLVTQGTVANYDLNALIVPTIRALAYEDVLVVATTGGASVENIKLDPLPDNVRVEQFIPYHFLLPHVDVMVTNGGYGSIQMALSNGAPVIVAGTTEEKPEIANRVAWAGVGIDLKTGTPSEKEIRSAVTTILHQPSYKNKTRQLQANYQIYDAPQRAADLSEQLLEIKAQRSPSFSQIAKLAEDQIEKARMGIVN
ncbi:MAG: glycosyltransferase [Pseudanabaenales cyanobacterium]|nr:glycosyltransferase [Pseudanabaenales cyanobacterium]